MIYRELAEAPEKNADKTCLTGSFTGFGLGD